MKISSLAILAAAGSRGDVAPRDGPGARPGKITA